MVLTRYENVVEGSNGVVQPAMDEDYGAALRAVVRGAEENTVANQERLARRGVLSEWSKE